MSRPVRILSSRRNILKSLFTAGVGVSALGGVTSSQARSGHSRGNHPPSEYDQFLVFIADGIWDPNVPPPVDAEYFDTQIMYREQHEIDQRRESALQHFEQYFGVTFAGVAGEPDPLNPPLDSTNSLAFLHIFADPAIGYRAVVVSNERVPRKGLPVNDVLYLAIVVNPDGATLSGSWGGAGTWVPQGTVLVKGEYRIVKNRDPLRPLNKRKDISIEYRGLSPVQPSASNILGSPLATFDCELTHESWGLGSANGRSTITPIILPTGKAQAHIRNVLSFPPPEWYPG